MPINFSQFANAFQMFRGNPYQMMSRNGLMFPQNVQNDPRGMIQYLMDSGKLSQNQYNQLHSMAAQIQNNPQFLQMFNSPRK